MAAGLGLGVMGSLLTRWEPGVRSLHYTPNRWLVLLVTLIVSGRLAYGLYRSFVAASAGLSGAHLVDAFGVPQSLAAGGIVIGYYLVTTWHCGGGSGVGAAAPCARCRDQRCRLRRDQVSL